MECKPQVYKICSSVLAACIDYRASQYRPLNAVVKNGTAICSLCQRGRLDSSFNPEVKTFACNRSVSTAAKNFLHDAHSFNV